MGDGACSASLDRLAVTLTGNTAAVGERYALGMRLLRMLVLNDYYGTKQQRCPEGYSTSEIAHVPAFQAGLIDRQVVWPCMEG